jgi:hypothetical protein
MDYVNGVSDLGERLTNLHLGDVLSAIPWMHPPKNWTTMGSSQSPALGCRYGLAMLRLLLEQEDVFQGTIHEDGWWTKLAGMDITRRREQV